MSEGTIEELEAMKAPVELASPIVMKAGGGSDETEMTLDDFESLNSTSVPREAFPMTSLGISSEKAVQLEKQPEIGFWESARRNISLLAGDLNLITSIATPGPGQVTAFKDIVSAIAGGERAEKVEAFQSPTLQMIRLKRTVDRLQADAYGPDEDELHARDIMNFQAFNLKMEEERIRGVTTGGQIAKGVLQLPEFMLSFLATGGMASVAKGAARKGVQKLLGESVKQGLKGALQRGTLKLAETAASGALRTLALPQLTVKGFAERRLFSNLELTETGFKVSAESNEKPITSFMKALGSTFVELSTEELGGIVTPLLGKGIKTVAPKFLPKGLIASFRKVYDRLHPSGSTEDFFRRMGQQTFFDEIEEEQISAIVQASLGIEDFGAKDPDSILDRVSASLFGAQELMVTAGIVAFPAGARLTTAQMVDRIQKRKKEVGFTEPAESKTLTDAQVNTVLALGEKPAEIAPPVKEVAPLQTEEEILDILAGKKPPPEGVPLEIFAAAVKDRAKRAEEVKPIKEKIKLTTEEQVAVQEAKAKFPEREVIIEGRTKRLAEELTTLQREGRLLQKTALEATEDVDSQIDEVQDNIDDLREERTKLVDEFQSPEKVDTQITALETEIGVLQKQKSKILQKLRSDEKTLQGRVDTARKKFDAFLQAPKAEAVKPKAAIVTTPRAILSVLARRVKQAQQFAKGEAKIVQSQLIQTLERARIPTKPFLRTIKNIQTLEQLKKQLPEFEQRIAKAQETSARRKLRSRITKKLARTKPRRVAGKPRGRLTADVQRTLDLMREASKLGPIEAELKIQNELLRFKGIPPSAEKALELSILSEFSDLGSKSLEQLEAIDLRVSQLIAAGREGAKTNIEKKRDKRAKELDEALTALPEIAPTATEKERRSERIKGAFASLGKSISGWADIMDVVFGKVMDSVNVTKVEQKEKGDVRRLMQTVELAGLKAFGFTKVKQLLNQFKEDTKKVDLGVLEDASGKEIRLLITKSEARKVWMELSDPLIAESVQVAEGGYLLGSVEIQGFTDAMVGKISEFLTTEDKLFVDAQLKVYRDFYSKINTQFRKDFGADLPFNPSYSPIKRALTQQDTLETFFEEMGYRRSISPTFLKTRVKNFQKIRVQSDMQVIQKHVAEMTHYLTWSEKMKQLEGIFGNNRLRSRIDEKYGRNTLKIIDGFVNDFRARDTRSAASVNTILDTLRTNFTVAALAFKPAIMVKQWTSFVAYAEDIPLKDFITGVADFAKSPRKAIKTLDDASDLLQTRGANINRDIRDALNSREFALLTEDPSLRNTMLWFTRVGDKGAILLGGWAVYRHTLKTTGSKQKAIEAFEAKTQQTQQSGDLSQQSQWQRAGSFAKLFTMFTSSQNQYLRRELAAIRQFSRKQITMQQLAKKIMIYHVILPQLFQWASNFFEFDEDEQLRALGLGSFNGIFLLGDILDSSLRLVQNFATDSDLPVFTPRSTPLDDLYKGFERAVRKVSKKAVSTEDVFEAIEDLLGKTVGPALGLPIKRIYDSYEGAEDLLSGEIQKGVLKLGGWSPWLVEKQLGKQKNPFD